LLATTVRLHDIRDVEAFVAHSLDKSGVGQRVSSSEREDLLAEGITILYSLSENYQPHRPGYNQEGCFSGYAAQFLPRRLGDAWHAANPGHRRLTAPDGSRTWAYEPAPASLDDEEAGVVAAQEFADELQEDMPRVRAALARMQPWQQLGTCGMINLVLDGYGWDEIAELLNMSREQLGETREQLAGAMAAEAVSV
jgi:hypothetical protein